MSRTAVQDHSAALRDGSRATGLAFGLLVDSAIPLTGLREPGPDTLHRACTLELAELAEIDARWPGDAGSRVSEQLYTDGSTAFAIDSAPEGYRIWSAGFGTYLVLPDGRTILCAPPDGPPANAQRVLIAQGLPLAASLQGLEVFHASAVVVDDRAIAVIGASGGGKTTLALHLVARGLRMFTDDALVVEPTADGTLSHPGPSVLHVDPARSAEPLVQGLGTVLGTTDKTHVALAADGVGRLPLGACYFLERSATERVLAIDLIEEPDPRLIMGSAFLSYHSQPPRLLRMLEAAAKIAASVALFRLRAPAAVPPDELAALVERHAKEALA